MKNQPLWLYAICIIDWSWTGTRPYCHVTLYHKMAEQVNIQLLSAAPVFLMPQRRMVSLAGIEPVIFFPLPSECVNHYTIEALQQVTVTVIWPAKENMNDTEYRSHWLTASCGTQWYYIKWQLCLIFSSFFNITHLSGHILSLMTLWFILDHFKQFLPFKGTYFIWHQPLKCSFVLFIKSLVLTQNILILWGKKKATYWQCRWIFKRKFLAILKKNLIILKSQLLFLFSLESIRAALHDS